MKMILYLAVTLISYYIGKKIYTKYPLAILNPLVSGSIITFVILIIFKIPMDSYQNHTRYFSFLTQFATVALAVPLYYSLPLLKKYKGAISLSIIFGSIIHTLSIFILAATLKLNQSMATSFLFKSVTTAIAKDLAATYQASQSLTVFLVVITGIIGATLAPSILKIFKIRNPIAKGVALGTSSHVVGTAFANTLSPLSGAISSLALILNGLLTVAIAPLLIEILKYII